MDQFQYKLLEPSEDPRDAKIEKSGVTVVFTLGDVEAHEAQLEKLRKETAGQLEIEKAKMANIGHFHPKVLKMSDELLTAAALYKEAKTYVAKAEPKLAEIEGAIVEYAEEKAVIMATLGFVKSEITPNASPDEQGSGTQS